MKTIPSRTKFLSLLVLTLLFAASQASASGNRMAKRFGAHLGLIGDPFPTLVGVNVNYNALEFLRLTAGYGSISTTDASGAKLSATTIGGGARLMMPGQNFTPVFGVSYANVSMSMTGTVMGTTTVGGFGTSGSHMYLSGGLDWQASSGFNFGAGYNYSLMSGVGGLPYFNFGWYF